MLAAELARLIRFLSAKDKSTEHLQFYDTNNSILSKTCRTEEKCSHGICCERSDSSIAD